MSGRVTIKSIAQDLGISHMTVSRALSGHPNVQADTRARIHKRARELGYVQSAAAKAMRGEATNIVGLLLPNIVNEFYARFANTMAEACDRLGLQLIIHLTQDDLALEDNAIERLREVQARAVVMVPSPVGESVRKGQLGDMQVIELIRRRSETGRDDVILVNDREAISEAVRHLAGQSHRRIAYIGADTALSSGRERLAAFKTGLRASGIAVKDATIITDAPSFEMGHRSTEMILQESNASAIICGGFEISNGALSELFGHERFLSGAFGFVGYGDPSFYSWVGGGISTIRVPVSDLALRAVELITAQARGSGTTSSQSFEATLIIRGAKNDSD